MQEPRAEGREPTELVCECPGAAVTNYQKLGGGGRTTERPPAAPSKGPLDKQQWGPWLTSLEGPAPAESWRRGGVLPLGELEPQESSQGMMGRHGGGPLPQTLSPPIGRPQGKPETRESRDSFPRDEHPGLKAGLEGREQTGVAGADPPALGHRPPSRPRRHRHQPTASGFSRSRQSTMS